MGGTIPVADFLTFLRILMIAAIILAGLLRGPAGLPWAVVFLLVAWTSDYIDGPIARRFNRGKTSWLGSQDLKIDMSVSVALLIYLVVAGFLPLGGSALYLGLWGLLFWRFGFARLLGMFFQAPLFAVFVYTALVHAPEYGRWLPVWLVAATLSPWPRFTPLWALRELKNGLHELSIRKKKAGP